MLLGSLCLQYLFLPFTLRWYLSLMVRCVSWMQQKYEFCFLIQLVRMGLLLENWDNIESYWWLVFIDFPYCDVNILGFFFLPLINCAGIIYSLCLLGCSLVRSFPSSATCRAESMIVIAKFGVTEECFSFSINCGW